MVCPANSPGVSRKVLTLLIASVLLVVSFAIPKNGQAGNLTRAHSVDSQQVIENDVFLTGEQPALDGVVNGDVFIVGSDVSVNGRVNGSLFILADNAELQGQISGNVFVGAVTIRQRAGASIGRSLYSLGVSLITEADAQIGRDLRVIAVAANLQGDLERDTRAVIGLFELLRLLRQAFASSITGLPAIDAGSLANTSTGAASGTPNQAGAFASMPARGSGIYSISTRGEIQRKLTQDLQPATDRGAVLRQWLLTRVLSLVAFLIVGALGLWLFPDHLSRWAGIIQSRPLASAGYGALGLINGFLLPILLVALIGGMVLGLLYLSLPSIAWMVLGAAFGSLTAAFSLFLLVVTYLSKAIVAFLAGSLILARLGRGAVSTNRWLALLLGSLIYVLLASIPYLGFAIGLAVTLLGMGAIWLARGGPDTQETAPLAA